MSDEELLRIAKDFRDGILDGDGPAFMCAMVCWPLAGYLHMLGVDGKCVETDAVATEWGAVNHVWIKLSDGRALDPTADQFADLKLPPVYLGKPLAIHQEAAP